MQLVLTSPFCRCNWEVMAAQSSWACDLKGAAHSIAAAHNSKAVAGGKPMLLGAVYSPLGSSLSARI